MSSGKISRAAPSPSPCGLLPSFPSPRAGGLAWEVLQRSKIARPQKRGPDAKVEGYANVPGSRAGTDHRPGSLRGRVKVNVLPLPTWVTTQIFPPSSSTSFLAKANPKPVPCCWR